MKKKHPMYRRIGWNYDNIKTIILAPLIVLISIVVTCYVSFKYLFQLKENYDKNKIIQESIRLELQEKIKIEQEEKLIKESIHLAEEQARIAEEERQKENKKLDLDMKAKLATSKIPIGTWVRDKNTNQVGKITGYNGANVMTDMGWYIELSLDSLDDIPSNIETISRQDYLTALAKNQKSRDRELAKRAEEAEELQIKEDTLFVKNYFKLTTPYGWTHFLYNGRPYAININKGVKGLNLKTKEEVLYFQDRKDIEKLQEISPIEYERATIKWKHENKKE